MKIGVIGAGSWGTALAALLSEGTGETTLWAYEPEIAESITQKHRNIVYFPEDLLPARLKCSSDLGKVVDGADVLVNAVPSHLVRSVWENAEAFVKPTATLVNASKGFELSTGLRLSQVLLETLPDLPKEHLVTLSGPSFAREVLHHQPSTVVIAGTDKTIMEKIQHLFRRDWFLTYLNDDVIGVEVGGAVKNVIAVACGICEGMGLGFNTRAALITRGLYEMTKLGKAMGANPLTFAGLSGMGDLILTCTGDLSRNRTLGLRLGRGEKLEDILKDMKMVAEGVKTSKVVYDLILKYKINNPVCVEIYRMLYENKPPRQALKDLLAIDLKEELGGLL
ncbi:MAG: NAD(P)H-dependent glycerol-3-phosphate dehydrogenase [Deltaproteobacteria bacterium]|nr:NAD(P)H-dependent glycerol-3-phosphate dehydrogenase [Deltaproteobacteria bacterium]